LRISCRQGNYLTLSIFKDYCLHFTLFKVATFPRRNGSSREIVKNLSEWIKFYREQDENPKIDKDDHKIEPTYPKIKIRLPLPSSRGESRGKRM
jgi:hypothetical protein